MPATFNNFTGNLVHNNSGYGFYFNGDTADWNRADYNQVYYNSIGAYSSSADYGNFSYNNVSYNINQGFYAVDSTTFWNITGNTFRNNSVSSTFGSLAGAKRPLFLRDASAMSAGVRRALRALSYGGSGDVSGDTALTFFVGANSNTVDYNTIERQASGIYVEWSDYLNFSYNYFNNTYFQIRLS